jgi:hypothetical protein
MAKRRDLLFFRTTAVSKRLVILSEAKNLQFTGRQTDPIQPNRLPPQQEE